MSSILLTGQGRKRNQRKVKNRLLGGHVSAAGGLKNAIINGAAIGANAIQIFGASPRQWNVKGVEGKGVDEYKEALGKSDIEAVYLHAAYLVNLATGDNELFDKSVDNLAAHYEIASAIGADGIVFHIGSSKDEDRQKVIKGIASGMKEVLKRVKTDKTKLIMENSSGGGGKIGDSLDDIGDIYKEVGSKRIGVCIDTAHIFESGVLDFEKKSLKDFFDRFDREIGLDNLELFHINDSKTDFGSFSDRHENLGQGKIGLEKLGNLAALKKLQGKPWILEVPGFDGSGPDKKNINILKSLFGL
ncbi:MAG: hypothetical protein COT88_00045 [Candidatus Colwellbacteria bacterium CG10_big_fil_rev_8_21_14_0_10_41_28]|uniref:Probable endonuclease 4 n=1 Tax=Candidatus Colwellbacteria bacterium CG10_big_fil_rev_8_21_14_0_10_41_28 TaxID=1974539 RepID=A0A2H0VI12_9BACT|nr:MAG: hypothetical protein COT88_00045 [Candidatus Colwellbacteria bacterium CG10_big_fil_rev_8_21_14_0_10_41_28]